jgi:hypothetical protein
MLVIFLIRKIYLKNNNKQYILKNKQIIISNFNIIK